MLYKMTCLKWSCYCVIVLVVLGQAISPSSAANAILSATSNTSLPGNQPDYCVVYNPDISHLSTQSKPTPSDYIPLVTFNHSLYDPYGCTEYSDGEVVLGKAVVVLRGNCTFYEKAYFAQSVNASLLVVVYNESVVYSVPDLTTNTTVITIPVLMVDNTTGVDILERLNSSPLYLYGYLPWSVTFDPSAVILLIIAVTTVLLGSYLANTPFDFLKYGLLIRKGSPTGRQVSMETEMDKYTIVGTLIGVLVMITLVCTLLVLLYFFYYPMVYIALAFYCVAVVLSLYYLLSPFVALIPIGEKCRLPSNKIPILSYRPDPLFFVTFLFSVAIVTWWVVERHSVYAWVLQDILGFAFITMLYQRLSFLKPWVVAVLMIILFFYDIFMVFITPFFTSDGVSVMEKAAIGPAGSSEKLPVVFTVMKFIYPTKLDTVCSLSRPFSLLGYGDVGIPGLLVTLALKHDLRFRPRKCFRLYFATSGIAYVVGLICTYIALAFMKTAQPALLYLVPTTLLSVTLMTLIRREFVLFFTGKPRKPKPNDQESDGVKGHSTVVRVAESEIEIDKECHTSDSEKSPLVYKTP